MPGGGPPPDVTARRQGGWGPAPHRMTTKRTIRPQWIWLMVILGVVIAGTFFVADAGGYTRIDSSAALQLIKDDKV